MNGKEILRVALISELVLVALAIPWFFLDGERAFYGWDLDAFFYGILAALPLLLLSFTVSLAANKISALAPLRIFQREYILPLCKALTPLQALGVSVAAGIGEELFFRGALTSLFLTLLPLTGTLLLVNFLFATVHFLGKIREFALLIPLYMLAGLYFSYIVIIQGSILSAITAHATFNFISILANKRFGA